MSITLLFEKVESGTAKVDRLYQTSYTRIFGVVSNTPKLRPGSAIQAVITEWGVSIGTHYKVLDPTNVLITLEEDLTSYVQSISAALASTSDDGCQWDVTVEYGVGESAVTQDYTDAFPADPIDHKLKISWGSSRFTKPVQYDISGNAIVNSADDFPEKTPEIDDSRTVLKIVRNQATFSPTLAQTYKNTVNGSGFTVASETFGPREVKCIDITADLAYHPEAGFYWPVTFEFEINPDTWRAKFLDEGFRTKDSTTHKKTNIVDESGQPFSTPQLLNGSGAKLAHAASPVVLSFDVYPESDFGDFAFDFTGVPGI